MLGKTISHYQITEKLGEGGMGVVYKARDTSLDRFVALKLLPADKLASTERKQRFVQEAKAASALNHPHIVTIHEISQEDGSDFIVMEYVAGKTLDALIPRNGMRLGEALKYAVQIADALAAAHAAGIIHRDIKPSNIMVGDDGRVRVLDFGLAKLAEQPLDASPEAPTITAAKAAPVTGEGTVLGTPNYMSPEQAQGLPIDTRSDIFSFGAVVYEMLTGRRAFQGDSPVTTMAAIVQQDPDPLPADITVELRKLVERCLRKSPDRRLGEMRPIRITLEDLKEESDSGKLLPAAAQPARRVSSRLWLVGAAAMAIIVASAVWSLRRATIPAELPENVRRVTNDIGVSMQPSISPDGRLIAYVSDRDGGGDLEIWVKQTAGGEPIQITDNDVHETEPRFSADGSRLVYISGSDVYTIGALGADTPRFIVPNGQRPMFSPDGTMIVYRRARVNTTHVVNAADGSPVFDTGCCDANWMRDGKHLIHARPGPLRPWRVPIDGGEPVVTDIMERVREAGLRAPRNLPGGILVSGTSPAGDAQLFSARRGDSENIWRIPIDPETAQSTGPAEPVTTRGTIQGLHSVADDGTMVYESVDRVIDIWLLPIDANAGKVTGELERVTRTAERDMCPSISRDGKVLAYLSESGNNWDVWTKNLETGETRNLSVSPVTEHYPVISRDGTQVAYMRTADKGRDLVTSLTEGGNHRLVTTGVSLPKITDWHPNLSSVLLDHRLMELGSGNITELLDKGAEAARFSPDGRWVTFFVRNRQTGNQQIFIAQVHRLDQTIERNDWIPVTSADGQNNLPDFSPDGNRLYFLSDRDGHRCLWTQRLDPRTRQPLGDATEVLHLPSARPTLELSGEYFTTRMNPFVAEDRIALALSEFRGNIWMMQTDMRK